MSMLENAVKFAAERHAGQIDKSGQPYIAPIMGVWSRLRDHEEPIQIIGLLHDIIEDTPTTMGFLRVVFGDRVASGVATLTHPVGTDYMEYIKTIALNPDALIVKLADLADNTDSTRFFRLPTEQQVYFRERIRTKYRPAIDYLMQAQRDRRTNGGRMV